MCEKKAERRIVCVLKSRVIFIVQRASFRDQSTICFNACSSHHVATRHTRGFLISSFILYNHYYYASSTREKQRAADERFLRTFMSWSIREKKKKVWKKKHFPRSTQRQRKGKYCVKPKNNKTASSSLRALLFLLALAKIKADISSSWSKLSHRDQWQSNTQTHERASKRRIKENENLRPFIAR